MICSISVVSGQVFFLVQFQDLVVFGRVWILEMEQNWKWRGKKNEEDIDKNRKKIGQKVFFFTSLFFYFFSVKSSFLFRGKVEKKKVFGLEKKRYLIAINGVFECFLVNNFGRFGRVRSCFFLILFYAVGFFPKRSSGRLGFFCR